MHNTLLVYIMDYPQSYSIIYQNYLSCICHGSQDIYTQNMYQIYSGTGLGYGQL